MIEAVELTEGILLDPVYSAKGMAGRVQGRTEPGQNNEDMRGQLREVENPTDLAVQKMGATSASR